MSHEIWTASRWRETKVAQAILEQKDEIESITARYSGWRNDEGSSLKPGGRIILFGMGSSYHVARLVSASLRRAENLEFIALPSSRLLAEVHPKPTDFAIAVSHRGTAGQTLDCLEEFYRSGAQVALVSAQGVHPPDWVDHHFETTPIEQIEPHTISVTGAVCALTTAWLGEAASRVWRELLAQHFGTDASLPGFSFSGGGDSADPTELARELPTLIVGIGADSIAETLASELALKLAEMARHPARVSDGQMFWHGQQYAISVTDRVWEIEDGTHPPLLAKTRENWDRLQKTLNMTRSLRVQVGESRGLGPLDWVPLLWRLQGLALLGALHQGRSPDLVVT